MVVKLVLALALLTANSCSPHGGEEEKAVERARNAAKAHPIFGRSMLDWQNPEVVDEGEAFRIKFAPAPGWMGGSVTYSVNKSNGNAEIVSAEQ